MTTNDAAERLRANINDQPLIRSSRKWWIEDLDAALAAERRATVERIRTRLIGLLTTLPGAVEKYPAVRAILDAEAER